MHARLLYWLNISAGVTAMYFLVLIEHWGKNPLPITEFLLTQKTEDAKAVWWFVDSGVSRYWNLLTIPFLASTLVLHDETDDFFETVGFVFFGLVAYGFLYLDSTEAFSFYFLILLALTTGCVLSVKNALRISYTILVVCGSYTWLFPAYSSGLFVFAFFALLFSALVLTCLVVRILCKKFQIFPTKTT